MKILAIAVSLLAMIGLASAVIAQSQSGSPSSAESSAPATTDQSGSQPSSGQPSGVPAPSDPSALPRAASEGTTIFGLTPVAAVLIAAAMFVVVILAIVAMTRESVPPIDRQL